MSYRNRRIVLRDGLICRIYLEEDNKLCFNKTFLENIFMNVAGMNEFQTKGGVTICFLFSNENVLSFSASI